MYVSCPGVVIDCCPVGGGAGADAQGKHPSLLMVLQGSPFGLSPLPFRLQKRNVRRSWGSDDRAIGGRAAVAVTKLIHPPARRKGRRNRRKLGGTATNTE